MSVRWVCACLSVYTCLWGECVHVCLCAHVCEVSVCASACVRMSVRWVCVHLSVCTCLWGECGSASACVHMSVRWVCACLSVCACLWGELRPEAVTTMIALYVKGRGRLSGEAGEWHLIGTPCCRKPAYTGLSVYICYTALPVTCLYSTLWTYTALPVTCLYSTLCI